MIKAKKNRLKMMIKKFKNASCYFIKMKVNLRIVNKYKCLLIYLLKILNKIFFCVLH